MSQIILPARPQMKEAYTALLGHVYLFRRDVMLLSEIQGVIVSGCGITPETADNWCRELAAFRLIEYVTSSVWGHWYVVRLYTKKNEKKEIHRIDSIDSWEEFDAVVREHLGNIVECDLALIRRSMNSQEESRLRASVIMESERLKRGVSILPGGDVLKSKFKTLDKETGEEAVARIEEALAKNKEKPGSELLGES